MKRLGQRAREHAVRHFDDAVVGRTALALVEAACKRSFNVSAPQHPRF